MACAARLARLMVPGTMGVLIGATAYAQDSSATSPDKHVYVLADFARFAPHTALDMLGQVPGFRFQYANQDRGLGQATENVLLNGQRVNNKSGGAIAELGKISAKQVERIEIVDAASLDIAGLTGQVANVITKAQSKGSGQFAWYPSFPTHFAKPNYAGGEISYSGKRRALGYTLGFETGQYRNGSGGPTIVYDAAGQAIEYREEVSRSVQDYPKGDIRLTLNGPVSGNFNLSYQHTGYDSTNVSDRDPVAGPASNRLSASRSGGSNIEVGGDLSFKLLGGTLKLIGLATVRDGPSISTSIATTAGAPPTGSKVTGSNHTVENIGRVEYGFKWGGADVQLSGEAAYNSLDGASRLFLLDPTSAFVETPFPGATLKVAEDRYEVTATYGRRIAKGLTLQLVAGGEHSTLSAGSVSRDFLRYKGSASLAWQAGARADVSLKLARVVEQLYFGQFLASINQIDDRRYAGNVTLVPPQSWKVDLEMNRKLGGWGSTRVRLYGVRTEDIIEAIPIGDHEEAQGNLDHAQRYGVEWQTIVTFDPIGWKGAKLDITTSLERSRLRDPLTGVARPISYNSMRQVNFNFRHDIPGSHWAWGAFLNSETYAPGYDLTEISRDWWTGPLFVAAFVEDKDLFGLKVRLGVDNIANAHDRRKRTVYNGWRTDPILFNEVHNRLLGPTVNLSVSGSF